MEITISELCTKLENILLSCSCLDGFYVGETDNLDETEERHKLEGFHSTILLAIGLHSIVTYAEEYMIFYFKKSSLKEKFQNKGDYSVGSKTANKIYVSIKIKPSQIEELDDDIIDWPEVFNLKS